MNALIFIILRQLDRTLCEPGTVLHALQILPHLISEIGTNTILHFTDERCEAKNSQSNTANELTWGLYHPSKRKGLRGTKWR